MNPDSLVLAYMRSVRQSDLHVERARRDQLHRAAVTRRRKAKRGGPR